MTHCCHGTTPYARDNDTTLQCAIDRLLDAAALANLLGAALSHWEDLDSNISGANEIAYKLRAELHDIQDDLTILQNRMRKGNP